MKMKLVAGVVCVALGMSPANGVPCGNCIPPVDINPCCESLGVPATCTRFDEWLPVSQIVLTRIRNTGTCNNVTDGCPCNPPLSPLTCTNTASVSFTNTVFTQLGGNLGVDAGIIELQLEATVGVSSSQMNTVSEQCSVTAPPCTKICVLAEIIVVQRNVRVLHRFTLSGVWLGFVLCGTCPIAGTPWILPDCDLTISTATANLAASPSCNTLSDCP